MRGSAGAPGSPQAPSPPPRPSAGPGLLSAPRDPGESSPRMTARRSLSSAGCTTASSRPCCHWAAAPNSGAAGSVLAGRVRVPEKLTLAPVTAKQHVCAGGQGRPDPAGGRVAGHGDMRDAGVSCRADGPGDHLHLHQRACALLHPRATGGRHAHHRQAAGGGGAERLGDPGSLGHPERAAQEGVFEPHKHAGVPAHPGQARGDRVPRPGGQPGPAQQAHGTPASRSGCRPRPPRRTGSGCLGPPPRGTAAPAGHRARRSRAAVSAPAGQRASPAGHRSRPAGSRRCARPAAAAAAREPARSG